MNRIGPMLIIVAAFLWACDGVIRRFLYTLPPLTIILFEHMIGLVILLPFVWSALRTTSLKYKDVLVLLVVALFSGLLGTLWFTTALLKVHFISFSVVFLLQKLQPIFAISAASLLLKEKIGMKYIPWALLALVAAYFVTFPGGHVSFATGEGTIIAALYALGAAFAWGSSTAFSKMILTKMSYTVSTFYRFLFTTIMALVTIVLFGMHGNFMVPSVPQMGLFTLIALSTGMVALLLYYKGLAYTKVHVSTILELTFPLIAIIIDMKVYHTTLVPSQWMAAFVLSFALYRISRLQSYDISNNTN